MLKYMGYWKYIVIENKSLYTNKDESLMFRNNWKVLGMLYKNRLVKHIDYWKKKSSEIKELSTKEREGLKNIMKISGKLYQREMIKHVSHWKCQAVKMSEFAKRKSKSLRNIWKLLRKLYQRTTMKCVSSWKYKTKEKKELMAKIGHHHLANIWKISGKLCQRKLMKCISHWKSIPSPNDESSTKQKKLEELCEFLENDLQFIRFRSIFDKEISLVSMNNLFHGIINSFQKQKEYDSDKITDLVQGLSFPLCPGEFARTILLNIDPSLTQNQITMIFENAEMIGTQGITADVFVDVMNKLAIGTNGSGPFCTQKHPHNKEITDRIDTCIEDKEEDSDEFVDEIDEGITNIKLIPNSPRKRKNVK